jgi:hypothetical protein
MSETERQQEGAAPETPLGAETLQALAALGGLAAGLSADLLAREPASPGLVLLRLAYGAYTLTPLLKDCDPHELAAGVEALARERPGAFLAGAFTLGLGLGRLARGQARDRATED